MKNVIVAALDGGVAFLLAVAAESSDGPLAVLYWVAFGLLCLSALIALANA